jgi:hypothetical protein
MNNNIKSAKLTLSHFAFGGVLNQNGIAVSNAYGSTDAFKLNTTWTNIDMRDVLGDMYDEYDEFNLVLTNMTSASHLNWSNTLANFGSASANDEINYIEITGLDFKNQGYDQMTKRNAAKATIHGLYFPNDSPSIPLFFNFSDYPMTFRKSYASPSTNINITFKTIIGGVPITDYDHRCIFNFSIYPVLESKTNKDI